MYSPLSRKGVAQAHLDALLPADDARRDHSVCRAHGAHATIEHDRCGSWRGGFQDLYVCVEIVVFDRAGG
jgi:hypothetical protein